MRILKKESSKAPRSENTHLLAAFILLQLAFALHTARADFFINTGPLNTDREFHSATLLPNGKVLVAGGWSSGGLTGSAELYDPATGTWSTTGPLPAPRYMHTATLLANGKVLVTGGWGNSALLLPSTVYDPAFGTWSGSGNMTVGRVQHSATLMYDGKVLVVGGTTNGSVAVATAEIYNPTTGLWAATTSMSVARAYHSATPLPSGKVLIAGGVNSGGVLSTAVIYDPQFATWSNTGALPGPRYFHTATMMSNGRVLVAGGHSGSSVLATAAIYNHASGTWSATGSMGVGRYYHYAAPLLGDGKVLVAGGLTSAGGNTAGAEIYNPASGTWLPTGSLNVGRYDHTVTALGDGRVLIAGGGPASYTPMAHAEVFIPTASTWTTTDPLNSDHEYHTASLLPNGQVLVAGGWSSAGVTAISDLYDSRTESWTTTGSMPVERYMHNATVLADGRVLVTGGWGSVLLASTAIYNPATSTWSTSGNMTRARVAHTATLLPNGKVLVTGGTTNGSTAVSSAELYNPATATWSTTTPMGVARSSHSATLLPDGRVLIAGGGGLSSAEIYNPATTTWSSTGLMPVGRSYHTACLLTNGLVLVAGGPGLSSAALYNPALNTWSATGSMFTDRYYHQMVPLPDGRVLVVGGLLSTGYNTPGCELYDPAAGTWSLTGVLNRGRYDHTATGLPNGKVLVAGGGHFSYEPMVNAELYAPFLQDPKTSGGKTFTTAIYASTGTQAISRYSSPSSGYSISRRLDIDDFWPFVDSGSWGFDSTSVPINGILKVPSGSGPFPLTLFVHGNHDPFDFSDEGYIYLCELLASWGVLAATIDANYMNYFGCCGENDGRAILHLEHVRQFLIWHTTPGHALYGKVDTNNIMIVGHSRGGEGVGHASYFNTLSSVVPDPGGPTVPLNGSVGLGPYGFKLKAVVAIAPTDGQYQPVTGPTVIRDNYLIFHGSRDGDVWTFDGYQTYDRAHPVSLLATNFKALAWSVGANHNYFNTTWIDEPDGSPTLTPDQQTNVARVYIGGMAQATVLGRPRYLDLLKNYEVGKNWLPSGAEFQSQYQDPKRLFINHYEEDDVETTVSPSVSGANSWSADEFSELFFNFGFFSDLYQETDGVRLSWISPSDYYQVSLSGSGVNSGAYQYLALRIGQSTEPHNPGGDQDLRIIIQDTAGGSAFYHAAAFPRLLYPDTGAFVPKIMMQSIRVPLSLVRDRVNLKNIALLKLAFDRVSSGTVYFDEVQLSN